MILRQNAPYIPRVNVIEPSHGFMRIDFRELWECRDLLFFLAWRDISVRYKQTVLGATWIVIQPLINMVLFFFVFGKLAGLGPDSTAPYAIWSFAGQLSWQYFERAFNNSANSLVTNTNLLTKVYFPRLIIPLSSVIPAIVDFFVSFAVFVLIMGYYMLIQPGRIFLTWHIVFLPVFLLLALLTALGVGLWLSALSVQFHDVPYVIPFIARVWMFASPVIMPVSKVPAQWQTLYALNPMVSVIEGFRWSLYTPAAFYAPQPSLFHLLGISTAMALVMIFSGTCFFKQVEKRFADVA